MKFYIRTPNKSTSTSLTNPRNTSSETQAKPLVPKPQHKCTPKPPALKKKKISFSALKKDTINSLNQVEYFLCNFQNICKYIKLYKILH